MKQIEAPFKPKLDNKFDLKYISAVLDIYLYFITVMIIFLQ